MEGEAPRPTPPPAPPPPTPKPAGPAADPKKAAAERLARILVSEIKLYNEAAVTEGRQKKAIYRLLKQAIDESRNHYRSRVAPEIASQGDFFHEELVRTLCQGDSALLGEEYPGPQLR